MSTTSDSYTVHQVLCDLVSEHEHPAHRLTCRSTELLWEVCAVLAATLSGVIIKFISLAHREPKSSLITPAGHATTALQIFIT